MEVYLIRHTTPFVQEGTCYGRTDLNLSESFEVELQEIMGVLPESFDQILSSPAKRCLELANKLPGPKVVQEDNLWEMNFGMWEMKNWAAIEREKVTEWLKDFVHIHTPGGENFLELYKRSMEVFNSIKRGNYQKVAVVTHGGVIRSFLSHSLGIPLENVYHLELNFGVVIRLVPQGSRIKVEFLKV